MSKARQRKQAFTRQNQHCYQCGRDGIRPPMFMTRRCWSLFNLGLKHRIASGVKPEDRLPWLSNGAF
jgi:hypothetical protein